MKSDSGWEDVYLSLGTNVGDRLHWLEKAVNALREEEGISVDELSSVFETQPLELEDQPLFLNMVVACSTSLAPEELLDAVKDIETRLGRVKRRPKGAREIDIDIILYGEVVIESDHLSIPHPRFHERKFVLVPLSHIAPELESPVHGKTVTELLDECPDDSYIHLYEHLMV